MRAFLCLLHEDKLLRKNACARELRTWLDNHAEEFCKEHLK
nr:MAG TPA_asm: hypothetical protein [Caudoviricetes sp.]